MRILRVAQKLYPDVKGGGPYHVHAMSRDQVAMGHDVTVLTVGDGPRTEQRSGYTVVRYPSTFSALGNDVSLGVIKFLEDIDTASFDILHAHSHLYASTNVAAVKGRLSELPLAITNHGLYSQTTPKWLFDVYLRTFGRATFNSADVVFCYTEAEKARLRNKGVVSPLEVVANGIDTEKFTTNGESLDAIAGDPTILFVGRLVEGKNPIDALEAFAILKRSFPNATLAVCGAGPLRSRLESRAQELGVYGSLNVLGYVAYDDMPTVYRSADALILPSRAEGFPRSILEAMASGVPVVVSDLDQVSSGIRGGGELVAVGNVEGFADALATVVEDGGAYSPRSIVEETYDWSVTVRRTTEILSTL